MDHLNIDDIVKRINDLEYLPLKKKLRIIERTTWNLFGNF